MGASIVDWFGLALALLLLSLGIKFVLGRLATALLGGRLDERVITVVSFGLGFAALWFVHGDVLAR